MKATHFESSENRSVAGGGPASPGPPGPPPAEGASPTGNLWTLSPPVARTKTSLSPSIGDIRYAIQRPSFESAVAAMFFHARMSASSIGRGAAGAFEASWAAGVAGAC